MTVDGQMTSSEEEILLEAERKTAQAYAGNPGVATNRDWTAAKKALEAFRAKKAEPASGETFRNIERAAEWVIAQGYLVSARTVRNHAERVTGFPRRQKDGSYLKSEIAAYAAATWENPSRPKDEPKDADYNDQVKRETARKLKLANDITEGKYLLKSEEEQRDAQVLYGVKLAVENWGAFIVQDLVALVAAELGEESSGRIGRITPELLVRYRGQSAELFDKFSKQGFIEVPDAD